MHQNPCGHHRVPCPSVSMASISERTVGILNLNHGQWQLYASPTLESLQKQNKFELPPHVIVCNKMHHSFHGVYQKKGCQRLSDNGPQKCLRIHHLRRRRGARSTDPCALSTSKPSQVPDTHKKNIMYWIPTSQINGKSQNHSDHESRISLITCQV